MDLGQSAVLYLPLHTWSIFDDLRDVIEFETSPQFHRGNRIPQRNSDARGRSPRSRFEHFPARGQRAGNGGEMPFAQRKDECGFGRVVRYHRSSIVLESQLVGDSEKRGIVEPEAWKCFHRWANGVLS